MSWHQQQQDSVIELVDVAVVNHTGAHPPPPSTPTTTTTTTSSSTNDTTSNYVTVIGVYEDTLPPTTTATTTVQEEEQLPSPSQLEQQQQQQDSTSAAAVVVVNNSLDGGDCESLSSCRQQLSSMSTSSTFSRRPYQRFKRILRKFLSINVIFTLVIVLALAIAIASVASSSLFSSRRIVLDISAKLRTTLSLQSANTINQIFTVAKRNMEVTIELFENNWDYLRDVFIDQTKLDGVINMFRSIVITDTSNLHMDVIFDDGSSILFDTLGTFYYVLYVSSKYSNFTADVSVFNQSTPESTTPLFKVKIPGWIATAGNASFWKLANEYDGAPDDYIISQIWTNAQTGGNVVALSRKLYYDDGQKYGVLSSVFTVELMESKLISATPSGTAYVLVTESTGSFIACTLPYSHTLYADIGDYISASDTNVTELIALNERVIHGYGGWEQLRNHSNLQYNSRQYGKVLVTKQELRFANRVWYVLVAWPETEWTKRVDVNTYMNIGIAFGVLIAAVVVTLCFSIPVTRSIHQIKECFNKIREMDLDSPVIKKTVKSRFIWYETSELQSSFKSMLSTLRSFQKYVPAYVVHRVVYKGLEASLGVTPENCSVFFLDIKDFTKLSEELNSRVLVEIMSEAFEILSRIIDDHGGIIDKYIGDCIMAFWQYSDHELKACRCALQCKQALEELTISLKSRDLPALECRIGINSGGVLMGNFGSTHRFNFTLIGDNVNLASRVESLNKQYDSTIMITENTRCELPENVFLTRRLERVQVKGKEKSTLVHELLGVTSKATEEQLNAVLIFEKAMTEYFVGNFNVAKELFLSIPDYEQDQVIVKKVVQCDEYRELMGENNGWNGILRMDLK